MGGGQPRVRIEPESLGLKLHSATDEPCDLGQVAGLPVCKIETTAIGERQDLLTELVRAVKQVTFARLSKPHLDYSFRSQLWSYLILPRPGFHSSKMGPVMSLAILSVVIKMK